MFFPKITKKHVKRVMSNLEYYVMMGLVKECYDPERDETILVIKYMGDVYTDGEGHFYNVDEYGNCIRRKDLEELYEKFMSFYHKSRSKSYKSSRPKRKKQVKGMKLEEFINSILKLYDKYASRPDDVEVKYIIVRSIISALDSYANVTFDYKKVKDMTYILSEISDYLDRLVNNEISVEKVANYIRDMLKGTPLTPSDLSDMYDRILSAFKEYW